MGSDSRRKGTYQNQLQKWKSQVCGAFLSVLSGCIHRGYEDDSYGEENKDLSTA